MAIVQFRVDDSLKDQATAVYENLGIDLSTALRMFLKRSIMSNGIPFSMTLEENNNDKPTLVETTNIKPKVTKEEENGEMTLDEINEEILRAREERYKHNQQL